MSFHKPFKKRNKKEIDLSKIYKNNEAFVSCLEPKTCKVGMTLVCTSTTDRNDMVEFCPVSTLIPETNRTPLSTCNCLPKRSVEQDLNEGINPLGSSQQGCYSVQENIVFPNVEGDQSLD